jgi:hypothetical protein
VILLFFCASSRNFGRAASFARPGPGESEEGFALSSVSHDRGGAARDFPEEFSSRYEGEARRTESAESVAGKPLCALERVGAVLDLVTGRRS